MGGDDKRSDRSVSDHALMLREGDQVNRRSFHKICINVANEYALALFHESELNLHSSRQRAFP